MTWENMQITSIKDGNRKGWNFESVSESWDASTA